MNGHFKKSAVFGLASAALLWAIAGFSDRFSAFPEGVSEMPVPELVCLLCLSSVLYLAAVRFASGQRGEMRFAFVFGTGLVMRAAGFFAQPVLEDDYFRYLWDGAVAAEGINPYLFSPYEAVSGKAGEALETLAAESGAVAERINHPHLTTIYPPATQVFFAVSHLVSEWSAGAWRSVLLGADIAVFFILRAMALKKTNLIIYWWNPLVVFTVFFSCHFDSLIFPFALGAVWAAGGNRKFCAVALLSLSVAVKLWTVALIAPLARTFGANVKKIFPPLALFALTASVLISPLFIWGTAENSGLLAYAGKWENNSSFFRIVLFISEKTAGLLGFHMGHGQLAARIFTAFAVAGGAAYAFFSGRWNEGDTAGRCLFVSAFVFLVIPAQFPWYYCWVVPFLALREGKVKWSLLSLTALLPLYYAQYHFEPDGSVIFRRLIVWIEFVPVWVMIVFENLRGKTGPEEKNEF